MSPATHVLGAPSPTGTGGWLWLACQPRSATDRLTIRWPSGQETVLADLEVDTDHEIVEPGE